MNIETKHLNKLWFHSEMNSDCVKWCKICKSSWIREQFATTHEKIFVQMIFWKQRSDSENHRERFIKRIEKINDRHNIQLQSNLRHDIFCNESNQRHRFESLSSLQSRHQNWKLNQSACDSYYPKQLSSESSWQLFVWK